MANIRLMPPSSGCIARTVSGRTYTSTVGVPIDVPDFDAPALEANGWTTIGPVSTTAARPTNPVKGKAYVDTTTNSTIYWDGKTWRDHAGNSV